MLTAPTHTPESYDPQRGSFGSPRLAWGWDSEGWDWRREQHRGLSFSLRVLEKGRERGKCRLVPTTGCFCVLEGLGRACTFSSFSSSSVDPSPVGVALQFPLVTLVTLSWPGHRSRRKVESRPAGSWPAPGIF